MTGAHRIVVSAENNAYTGWQCKLFYFSCVTRLNHQPIIVVHESGNESHPDFYDLVKAGCRVHSAPNYRITGHGDSYYPRNTAGSLIHAGEICSRDDLVVLCDSDMIFARAPQFPSTLSGDFVSYMNYDREVVVKAKNDLGIVRELGKEEEETLRCGVPYVIPAAIAKELGHAWLQAVDAFPPRRWEDIMYAFGLAVVKLGLEVQLTHLAAHNFSPTELLTAPMIHYCYGDERWSKRDYFHEDQARAVWNPTLGAPDGTILGELIRQIRDAAVFYRDVYFPDGIGHA